MVLHCSRCGERASHAGEDDCIEALRLAIDAERARLGMPICAPTPKPRQVEPEAVQKSWSRHRPLGTRKYCSRGCAYDTPHVNGVCTRCPERLARLRKKRKH